MTERLDLYCAGCGDKIVARLTDGKEVYPHRPDLYALPFWKCDDCGNTVGCHWKTKDRTRPLGIIATPELKRARQHIHRILDPIWQNGGMSRKRLYATLTKRLGWRYHTAKIRSVEEARKVYRLVREISASTGDREGR